MEGVLFFSTVTDCLSESICVFREINPDLAGIGVGQVDVRTEFLAET